MRNERLQPWGCDQQGRYETRSNARYDKWADDEWRDTVDTTPVPLAPLRRPRVYFRLGDLLMVIAIIGTLAWIISLGQWL